MTTYPHRIHVGRPHVSRWVVATVVFAAAFAGLGAWVLVDRYGGGGATQDATTLIDNFNTALGAGDATAIAGFLAPNVQVRSLGDTVTGSKTLATGLAQAGAAGLRIERVAPVTVEGQFATTFNRYVEPGQTGTFLSAYQIKDGQILRIWGYRPGVNPPFENAVLP